MEQDAWARGQHLAVHGCVYGLRDGRLRDLGFFADRPDDVLATYDQAVAAQGMLGGAIS